MNVKLNPDKEVVNRIRAELKNTNGYCPCMIEQNEDTKCPCLPCRTKDECICGLYVKKE